MEILFSPYMYTDAAIAPMPAEVGMLAMAMHVVWEFPVRLSPRLCKAMVHLHSHAITYIW